MHLSLHTSVIREIGSFTSPVVPRVDELIDLAGSLFLVIAVSYCVTEAESNHVDLDVQPANEAARQRVGDALHAIHS